MKTPTPPHQQKEEWELWIDDLMGEKLYQGKKTEFTATHVKDYFRGFMQSKCLTCTKLKDYLKRPKTEGKVITNMLKGGE